MSSAVSSMTFSPNLCLSLQFVFVVDDDNVCFVLKMCFSLSQELPFLMESTTHILTLTSPALWEILHTRLAPSGVCLLHDTSS